VLDAAVRRAEQPMQALAALFTLGGAESICEVRVEGDIVFAKQGVSGAGRGAPATKHDAQ
jgi:hypothetical protein